MATKKMTGRYVIVRASSAGAFAGTLLSRSDAPSGTNVVLTNARRLWYWSGAASLSQLAVDGTTRPAQCKFPVEVAVHEVLGVCEIIDVTDAARESIAAVPVWRL